MTSFLDLIYSKIPQGAGCDKMSFQLTGDGVFSECSYYKVIWGSTIVFFPWKSIWRVKASRQVSLFVWTTTWGRILTHDNHFKQGNYCSGLVLYVLVWWGDGCSLAASL